MWNTRKHPSASFVFATITALALSACAGDDPAPPAQDPGQSAPDVASDALVAHGADNLAPQWNTQNAKVADCPAYKDSPSAVQMARWGWDIVEVQGDEDAKPEAEEMESSASPTASVKLEKVRFQAHVVRASSEMGSQRALRFTARRTSAKQGVEVRADAVDRLDGRPGRAELTANKRVFAVVFPDPYHAGDLGVAATFDSEGDLLESLPEGSPRDSFEAVSEAIHAERAQLKKMAAEAATSAK
ncbi:MAG: hypothetical protein U0441_00890 [Polyangiaceae bacterium]